MARLGMAKYLGQAGLEIGPNNGQGVFDVMEFSMMLV